MTITKKAGENMFLKLLLLFVLVPITELTLLVKLGGYVGFLATLVLIAITGIVGGSLARNQGFLVINQIRDSLSKGKLPADSLIEGLLILIGGVMLLTPGLLTDVSGFSLVIPGSRRLIREVVKQKFKKQIKNGNIKFNFFGSSQFKNKDNHNNQSEKESHNQDEWEDISDSIDVDYEEIEDDK
jgi:UPF0716 protein FxsA